MKGIILEIVFIIISALLLLSGYVNGTIFFIMLIISAIFTVSGVSYFADENNTKESKYNNVKRLRFGFVNCYAVRTYDGNILVDTGCKSKRRRIYKKAADGKDIKLIILTHNHPDHIGNAKYLSEKLRVPIAMSEEDYYDLKTHSQREMYAHTPFGRLMLKFINKPATLDSEDEFVPDIFLKDGDNLIKYGVNAQIISLKGHSRGSIGILVEDNELIVGDAMVNYFFPSSAKIYQNYDLMNENVDKIKSSGVGDVMVYPGHGMPFVVK